VTGENTALITGDLTIKDTTRTVVLDTVMNKKADAHPMNNRPWIGFDATTTLLRSDFGVDMAVPFISDEVELRISIEAGQPE
jgi:polyisoprenoid-binding protein YceI